MNRYQRVSDPRGQVVITRFECPSLYALLLVLALHRRVKREVRRVAGGYLGGTTVVLWSARTVLSISLWDRLDSIYAMGEVQHHILASRVPARLGASTSCGIYTYRGDWRQVMFGTPTVKPEPLFAIAQSQEQDREGSSA